MKRMRMTALAGCAMASALLSLSMGCRAPEEAPRVLLPVVSEASAARALETDLGYAVELTEVRVAMGGIVFTIAGEAHLSSTPVSHIMDALIPSAHAHPGHLQGGDVTGELPGDRVVNWSSMEEVTLGEATLLAGEYTAANFAFGRGSAESLGEEDPLVGHTAILSGTATREGESVDFSITIDSPEDRVLVGAPFEATLSEKSGGRIILQFRGEDAEGDTLLDGVDFAALDQDQDGKLAITPGAEEVEDAYNSVRRAFQTHDHYRLVHEE